MKRFVDDLVASKHAQPVQLLEILRVIQARYQHIPADAIEQLAERLAIPRTQIIAVCEFYSFFSLQPRGRYQLLLSDSITDHMSGKQALLDELSEALQVKAGTVRADGVVSLDNTSCTGLCDQGPAGLINGYPLPRLNHERIHQMSELINQQKPLSEWPVEWFHVDENIRKPGLLLTHLITPGQALNQLSQKGADTILQEIDQAALRGRGGAGFNTALKWRYCLSEPEQERYIVCNADEGEPGTFKDRVLLTGYADQIFEGMTVGALIIGAKQGFLYLRGEYRFLLEKLQSQLTRRRNAGLLGANILGTGRDFDIEIRLGAGAYICGEESALIESLEGKMGIPRNRPPYPVTQGYLGKPTVVNNVETFFAAAAITVHGGEWFAANGTEKSKGSKILSISGDCARPGIYEYPFGTPVQTILNECGAKDTLGVQVGGPSGVFIAEQEFQRTLAFEDLATGGSFIIFDNRRDILAIVSNFTHFFAHESCGFCTPCRVGTALLKKQLDKITEGYGSAGDVAALEELCALIKNNSHCGLGQTAANPVLATLARFPERYQNRLKKISYEPGFDLDAALETARRMAGRNDERAHLTQVEDGL